MNLKIVFSIVSLSYLVYVAFQVASANRIVDNSEKKTRLGVVDGVIIQLVNPKAYAVGVALFSGFPQKGRFRGHGEPLAGRPHCILRERQYRDAEELHARCARLPAQKSISAFCQGAG